MGLAEDLLDEAVHLAGYRGANQTRAALRRSVSTAYYARFRLLVEDAAERWQGSAEASTGIERAFRHGTVKNISSQFSKPIWMANSFVILQEERHVADYDNHEHWPDEKVQDILKTAHAAFESWLSIRTGPMAGNYLLARLLSRQRV